MTTPNEKTANGRRDELARRILRTPPMARDALKVGKPKPAKGKSPVKRAAKKPRRAKRGK